MHSEYWLNDFKEGVSLPLRDGVAKDKILRSEIMAYSDIIISSKNWLIWTIGLQTLLSCPMDSDGHCLEKNCNRCQCTPYENRVRLWR